MHQWHIDEVRWNNRHIDLVRREPNGVSVIDYTAIHDVLPLEEEDTPSV